MTIDLPIPMRFGNSVLMIKKCTTNPEFRSIIKGFLGVMPNIFEKMRSAEALFIKVNLTSDELPENGRTTNPFVLQSVIEALMGLGIQSSKIIVGDSSVIGVNTMQSAITTGILGVCKEYNITFLDLNSEPYCKKNILNCRCQKSIAINEIAFDQKLFKINFAKIKTTYGSPVGLCIKNLKGLISQDSKLSFHLEGVQESLVDLRSILTCDLNILEGLPASELGIPKPLNLFGVSDCDILLDAAISHLIGIPYSSVPHLDILVNRYIGNIDFGSIPQLSEIKLEIPFLRHAIHGMDDLATHFKLQIIDCKPCTSCLESFYKCLSKLPRHDFVAKDYCFVLGLWHSHINWEIYKKKKFVFVGKCALQTPMAITMINGIGDGESNPSRRSSIVFIPGCSPTIDSIFDKLNKMSLKT